MRILSIYMQAGGVGKTSITSMLAYELSHTGKVLIIDADQQSNTTLQFLRNYGNISYVIENKEIFLHCCKLNEFDEEDISNIENELEKINTFCQEQEETLSFDDFFINEEIITSYCDEYDTNYDTLELLKKTFQKYAQKNCRDFLSVLKQDCELKEALIEVRKEDKECKGLFILPSRNKDSKLQNFYESVDFREEPEIIEKILEDAENLDFEYVFFDLPPTFGYAQKILLSNCTDIIPIINPDEKSIDGLIQFNNHMDKLKKQYNGKFTANNFLVVNREKKDNKVHQHWIGVLKDSPYKLFELSDSNSVTSAASQKKVLQEWQKSSKLNTTIKNLADEIIGK